MRAKESAPAGITHRTAFLLGAMAIGLSTDQTTLLGGHPILPRNTLLVFSGICGLIVVWLVRSTCDFAIGSLLRGATPWLLGVPAFGLIFAPVSVSPGGSVLWACLYLIAGCATAAATNRLGIEWAVRWIAAALALQVLVGLPVEVFGPNDPVALEISTDSGLIGLGRFRGVFDHPNELGQAAGLLVVSALVGQRSRAWFVPLGLVFLVVSQSRTALLALFAAICVMAWQRMTRRQRSVLIPTFVVAIALAVGVLVVQPRAARLIERNDNPGELVTFTGRTAIWGAAIDQIKVSPVVGVGLAGADVAFVDAHRRGAISQPKQHAHNGVLHVALTTGIVSAVSMLVGLGVLLFRTRAGRWAPLLVFVIVGSLTEALFGVGNGWLEVILFTLAGSSSWAESPSQPLERGHVLGLGAR